MRYQDDSALDEPELLQRIVEGDMLAFEAFYKGYFAAVPFHPEDDPQSGFSRGGDTKNVIGRLGKTDGFNHESRISTWVFGIAYHKALKLISKDVHHGTGVDVDELAETLGDPAPIRPKIMKTKTG